MGNKLIDTHAHFLNNDLKFDTSEIESNLLRMDSIFHVAWNIESSEKILMLFKTYKNLYPVVGIHPSHVIEKTSEDAIKELETIILNNQFQIKAIGEIGIDLFHTKETLEVQKVYFYEQLVLAKKYNLPIVLHIRNAFDEVFDILLKFQNLKLVIHSWNASIEVLEKYKSLNHDLYFGINGILTFKNALDLHKSILNIPLDKILLETDMPYLSPIPYRGKKNQSIYLIEVAKKLALILNISLEDVAFQTTKNARVFYELS